MAFFQAVGRRGLFGLLWGLLLLGCAEPSGTSLRLVTWNIHAAQAGVDSIADQLRRLEPDIICLQEVESGGLESPSPNQAQRIARQLGMNLVFTPAPQFGSKEEQIAILAHGDLAGLEGLMIDTGRHYGITAELPLSDGTKLRVVNVHLTSNDWSDVRSAVVTGLRRLREVSDLVRRLEAWDEDVIVAGDFNAGPGMLEHACLALRMRSIGNRHPTFPNDDPVLQLDHVFLKGALAACGSFVERTRFSDHRPLVADICLGGRLLLAPSPLEQSGGTDDISADQAERVRTSEQPGRIRN